MKKFMVLVYITVATVLFGYAKADDNAELGLTITQQIVAAEPPVSFEELSARFVKNNVEINWATATELGNKQFEIQRSADGEDFKTIGIVFTLNDSNAMKNYKFKDELKGVKDKKIAYRIKQVDMNEQFSFSKTVMATATGS